MRYIYIYIYIYAVLKNNVHSQFSPAQVAQYKWSKVVHDTQRCQVLQKQDGRNVYLMMNVDVIIYSYLISLVYWYQQCVTLHHLSKYMSCHKAIVLITGIAHFFYTYPYVTPILLL